MKKYQNILIIDLYIYATINIYIIVYTSISYSNTLFTFGGKNNLCLNQATDCIIYAHFIKLAGLFFNGPVGKIEHGQ